MANKRMKYAFGALISGILAIPAAAFVHTVVGLILMSLPVLFIYQAG